MNTSVPNPATERRWPTYAKAGIFTLPAVIAWVFACLMLVPKVKEICALAGGMDVSQLGWVGPAAFFVFASGREIMGAGILALVLMELVAPRWRWRKLAVGTSTWLVYVAVLFALCMLLVIVLVAAPSLTHAQ